MKVYDIEVHGINRALRGLARSFNSPIENMHSRAIKLGPLDRGHNKFLRMIHIWAEVEAPRFWWAEYDTYKVGTVAQSDSTMHTLHKRPICQDDFEYGCPKFYLDYINSAIANGSVIQGIKNDLPEGFIQGRTINLNYAVLREMTLQRHSHRLPQWKFFLNEMLTKIPDIELLGIPNEILNKLEIKIFHTMKK